MATNNDISLDPEEEQDGLWGPGAHAQALTCAQTQAHDAF